ncbi:MAG: hypothetical protein Q8S00_19060 [Deltaproteobacteria bacterium]|nr:hypothetical protein [Deltaproteobacteria bacterium]MDZ4345116.1 hypothetical protein [Candidatus Binatia bacterium]
MGGIKFSFEIELLSLYRTTHNLQILFHATERAIQRKTVPLGNRWIGNADPQQIAPLGKFIEADRLKR